MSFNKFAKKPLRKPDKGTTAGGSKDDLRYNPKKLKEMEQREAKKKKRK